MASHDQNEADEFILDRAVPGGTLHTATIAETAGDVIGRYKLLERIGEGGMGLVYMAEQTKGVRRRVALKIIKLGMDTRQVIARFEAERQALALFDHPNITRVLDAGSTTAGRPYFVMELVRGVGITEYVQGHELKLPDRLALFTKVCRAVHHAHQKGVIHRDLKPSNILITQYDGMPVPKVIDFGIAKAMDQQTLTEKTLFTRYASMVGTPQYMSPEQAEMTGLDIDTRADIYSLGVILYELITGSTPLEAKELKGLNALALFETLRDANIETPSLRLSRLQDETASQQDARPQIPPPISVPPARIQGGLDWIILKSIARDRRERYHSAMALAEDVERFLAGDPVEAAPPSKQYLLKTLLKKYRTAALSVFTTAILLLLAASACFVLALSNYRTNERLTQLNTQLSKTVDQLQKAEAQIRATALQDKYATAISIAFMQYDVQLEHIQMSQAAFEKPTGNQEGLTANFNTLGFGFNPDDPYPELLGLSQRKLLKSALQPIDDWLTDDCAEFEIPATMTDEDLINAGLMIEDPGYDEVDFQKAVEQRNSLAVDVRDQFFRYLLNQYRRVFGEDDPRVAEALNLLAGCLIEMGETDEAEARLRESMALGNEHNQSVARKLLQFAAQPKPRQRSESPLQ
ncbi:MAG: serine/threonine-protein kinase [Planctomycetota bacterium]